LGPNSRTFIPGVFIAVQPDPHVTFVGTKDHPHHLRHYRSPPGHRLCRHKNRPLGFACRPFGRQEWRTDWGAKTPERYCLCHWVVFSRWLWPDLIAYMFLGPSILLVRYHSYLCSRHLKGSRTGTIRIGITTSLLGRWLHFYTKL
jgi:hypothetical protein